MLAAPGDLPMLLAEVELIPAGRLACLIYTSGTGGTPRGVMLPHRAMLANRDGVAALAERLHLDGTVYLSFLPLSHSYEHTVGVFLLPSLGVEVVYSRGADRHRRRIPGIPAEHRHHRAAAVRGAADPDAGPAREGDAVQAEAVPARPGAGAEARRTGRRSLAWERLQDAVLDRLVRDKVRARFGGRLQALVSGGARLDPDLSGFFIGLGLPLIQGYGQTEAGPVIAVNPPWDNLRQTVGYPLPGVEARLAADGELLVRGALVMDGYWGNPEATAAAIRPAEGDPPGAAPWLHTGDVASIEAAGPDEGRITITDRKRDFIKTLGGDMVSPAKLESLLMAEPEIAQAVVAGEGQAGVVALLVAGRGPGGGHRRSGRPGECQAVQHRAHPPLDPGTQPLLGRERAADADDEGEAPGGAGAVPGRDRGHLPIGRCSMADDTAGPNAPQAAYWNGPSTRAWATHHARIDARFAPVLARALDRAAPRPGARVLDIGCGSGTSTLALAERVGPQGAVLGLDIAADLVAVAERRIAAAGLAQARVMLADAATHPFEPGGLRPAVLALRGDVLPRPGRRLRPYPRRAEAGGGGGARGLPQPGRECLGDRPGRRGPPPAAAGDAAGAGGAGAVRLRRSGPGAADPARGRLPRRGAGGGGSADAARRRRGGGGGFRHDHRPGEPRRGRPARGGAGGGPGRHRRLLPGP